MWVHSRTSAWRRAATVCVGGPAETRRPSSSQACSIGAMSGLSEGHGSSPPHSGPSVWPGVGEPGFVTEDHNRNTVVLSTSCERLPTAGGDGGAAGSIPDQHRGVSRGFQLLVNGVSQCLHTPATPTVNLTTGYCRWHEPIPQMLLSDKHILSGGGDTWLAWSGSISCPTSSPKPIS